MPEDNEDIDFEFESEKLLRGIEAELAQVEIDFQNQTTQLRVLEDEESELRKRLQEIAYAKRGFDEIRFDHNRKVRRLQTKAEDVEQRLEIERANRKHAAEIKSSRDQILKDTEGLEWRKFVMDFQLEGALSAAVSKRFLLADSMGLGKTIESIAYLDMVKSKRALIICPGEVIQGFFKSLQRWAPHRIPMMIGRMPKAFQETALTNTIDTLTGTGMPIAVIVNYESWARNKKLLDWIADAQFDTIVCDESHEMKNTSTSKYKGVFKIINSWNIEDETDRSIKNVLCMTGTPILNRPGEIFANLRLIEPGTFASEPRFIRNYCDYTGEGWGPNGQERLAAEITGKYYLRRKLGDTGITLPPQEIIEHDIELDEQEYALQTEIIEMIRRDSAIQIDEGSVATIPELLALLTRSRQAATWPGGIWMNIKQYDEEGMPVFEFDHDKNEYVQVVERVHVGQRYQQSAKIDAAVELFDEMTSNGMRVAIFSQFKEALKELEKRLEGRAVRFDGDTPTKQRDIIKSNFDITNGEAPKWEGILAHYRTGGVGLNLTACTAIIILDEEWNPGKAQQAYDRIHRFGQEKETQVHILRITGPVWSIDSWMRDMIERKGKVVDGFELSVKEFGNIFKNKNSK